MGAIPMWKTVKKPQSLSERIVAQVEQVLHEEQLRPGDQLPPERELARLLGVSRPSLREAISVLQTRGQLVVKHGHGTFVAQLRSEREMRDALTQSEINLREVFAMREVLEVPAAGWAAERSTPELAEKLRGHLRALDRAFDVDPEDFGRLAALDAAFHFEIVRAAGNSFLERTTDVLNDLMLTGMNSTLLVPGRREQARREHERIVAAVESGNVIAAKRTVRNHIRNAYQAATVRPARSPRAKGVRP